MREFPRKASNPILNSVLVLIVGILLGLLIPSCTYGATNSIPTLPPLPESYSIHSASAFNTSNTVKVITVYQTEIVTNTDFSTTWVKYAVQTNHVNIYPKQLYIQPMQKDTLSGEWAPLTNCRPFIIQLGFTSTNEYYTAKLSIK